MTDTSHLTTALPGDPIDLQRLDGTIANLRRAERDVATVVAFLTKVRDRLAAAPDDAEARRAVRMAELRMRGDAFALAQDFTALATPEI